MWSAALSQTKRWQRSSTVALTGTPSWPAARSDPGTTGADGSYARNASDIESDFSGGSTRKVITNGVIALLTVTQTYGGDAEEALSSTSPGSRL